MVVLKHSFVEGLDGASIKSKGLTITIVGEMDGPEQASNVVSMRIVFLVDEDSFVILSLLLVPTRHELHRFRRFLLKIHRLKHVRPAPACSSKYLLDAPNRPSILVVRIPVQKCEIGAK